MTSKFVEFTVGVSHTFNLGNYESMRVEASVTVSEPTERSRENAQIKLRKLIEDTMKAQPHSELRTILANTIRQERIRREKLENEYVKRTEQKTRQSSE